MEKPILIMGTQGSGKSLVSLGFNKRIVRYNAKQGRVTYAGITSTLSEFEEIWTKEMNDIQDFITKCNQQSICGVTNDS